MSHFGKIAEYRSNNDQGYCNICLSDIQAIMWIILGIMEEIHLHLR